MNTNMTDKYAILQELSALIETGIHCNHYVCVRTARVNQQYTKTNCDWIESYCGGTNILHYISDYITLERITFYIGYQ